MQFCSLCQEHVSPLYPATGGDAVCPCGWVLQSQCANEVVTAGVSPPARYKTSSGIATAPACKGRRGDKRLQKLQSHLSTKGLYHFNKATEYKMQQLNSECLHLPQCVLDLAVEIYEIVAPAEKPRSGNRECLLPVCLYLACKAQDKVSGT